MRCQFRECGPIVVGWICVLMMLPACRLFAAEPQFAGTFKSDRMTIKVERDGAGGAEAYNGAIEMGANKFPVHAEAKDGMLKGTFKDNKGQSFEFTASLSADDMSFVTSGTTFALKRQAAAVNPLAQRPVNPLAGLGIPDATTTAAAPVNPLDPPRRKPQNPLDIAGGGTTTTTATSRSTENRIGSAGSGTTAPTTTTVASNSGSGGGNRSEGEDSGVTIVIVIIVIVAVLAAGGVAIAYALNRKRSVRPSA
jgi:hypothetical protein